MNTASEQDEIPVGRLNEDAPVNETQLMEHVVERFNLHCALHKVRSNKGSAGVDGMTVDGLPAYLKQHWPTVKAQLLNGTYQPRPVKQVKIPKPDDYKNSCRLHLQLLTTDTSAMVYGYWRLS